MGEHIDKLERLQQLLLTAKVRAGARATARARVRVRVDFSPWFVQPEP